MMENSLDFLRILPESWKNANAYYLNLGGGWLIDPGPTKPADFTDPADHILATHGHYDHMAGIDSWLNEKGQFYLHEGDLAMLGDPEANASRLFAHSRAFPEPRHILRDGDRIEIDEQYSFEVWHSPGHTEGSSCFLLQRKEESGEKALLLFSGDCFFADSVGRSDLPGGDPKLMRDSIEKLRLRLQDLPETMPVLPGHGRPATAKDILDKNPFFRKGGFFGF